jgi:hypothetical protein
MREPMWSAWKGSLVTAISNWKQVQYMHTKESFCQTMTAMRAGRTMSESEEELTQMDWSNFTFQLPFSYCRCQFYAKWRVPRIVETAVVLTSVMGKPEQPFG